MGEFSSEWLALREPADHAARSGALTRLAATALPSATEVAVLDLAAGSGSNPRYLIERLPPRQQWLLADHDHGLLDAARTTTASWAVARGYRVEPKDGDRLAITGGELACDVSTRQIELATFGGAEYQTDLRGGPQWSSMFTDRTLVTASALLDLVSESWLQTLAVRCCERRAVVLFALTYDGRIECTPEEPEDAAVRTLVARHQHTDKGFGPALGPDATSVAARCLGVLGYEVHRERSDWVLTPDLQALQEQLVTGWADAAAAIDPTRAEAVRRWASRRLAHIAAGRSRIVVGHEDLAAWLR